MNNLWSEHEINFLNENYKIKSYKEIGALLNRSENSVEKKIKRLGLIKKDIDDYTYWNDDKLSFLIKNYNDYSCKEIGDILGFSEKKIIKKLSDLKLKKKRIYKKIEKSIHNDKDRGDVFCKVCNCVFKDLKGLEIHIVKKHKEIDIESYFILNNIGNIKKCRICGNKGRFISLKNGYRDLCNNESCIKKSYETGSIDFWINKGHTEEEAKLRFDEYTKKRISTLLKNDKERLKENPNYYIDKLCINKSFWKKRGYSEFDAIFLSNKIRKDNNIKMSETFISNPEKYVTKYPTKIEYYLHRGFTKEQAIEMISERQKTFILEKLINKYGEDKAKIIYNKRQEKWMKSLHENGNLKSGYSLVSQELFNKINDYFIDNSFQYMIKNGEFIISKYSVDFIDHNTNRIIEFNGDLYHANPEIFKPFDKPNPWNKNLLAESIWEKDDIRNKLMESLGYQVLVVWESEYRKNSEQILEKCIDFINKK